MGKHTAEHQGLEAIAYRRDMLETGKNSKAFTVTGTSVILWSTTI